MNIKILSSTVEILAAKALIYAIFVEEQGWEIKAKNPSKLKAVEGEGHLILCDAYDAVATWFGVYDGEELIACNRHCSRLDGKFELEHYHPLPDFIQQDAQSIEINRLVVRKKYRSTTVVTRLIQFGYSYGLQLGYGHFFATGYFPYPGGLYIKRFGLVRYGERFRYFEDEVESVYLYYIDFGNRSLIEELISRMEERVKSLRTVGFSRQ